jgi:hypothetical protein
VDNCSLLSLEEIEPMKKIACLVSLFVLCLAGTANACPPLGAAVVVQPAFVNNAVLLPQVAVAVQQPVIVQQPIAFAGAGFGSSAFVGSVGFNNGFIGGARFGFGAVGVGGGFVGGFRGPRVTAFSRVGPFGGSVSRVRVGR